MRKAKNQPSVPPPEPPRPLRVGLDMRLAFKRGVGTYAARLLMALAASPRNLDLVAVNAPPDLKAILRDTPVRWADTPPTHPALYEQTGLPAVARREKLDLLHYVDNSATVLWNTPYVLTLHDAMVRRPLKETIFHPTWRQRFLHLYKRMTVPESARSARLVLTVSQHSKRDLVSAFRVPEDRIRVIPEGVDAATFARPKDYGRRLRGPARILIQGALDPRKNLLRIFAAGAILRRSGVDFRMTVIGAPKADFQRAGITGEADRIGIGNLIEWPGRVSTEDLPRWYWESDLFLYPSLWEGFGLPVLEAFAAGTPVVASNVAAIPEVAGNAAYLVDPTDTQALARAIQEVLERPVTARSLVSRGLKRARSFTWEVTAELTAAAYREAAEVRS
jgi:glycosyltransferase involved in cell wall biosynthesis